MQPRGITTGVPTEVPMLTQSMVSINSDDNNTDGCYYKIYYNLFS